MKVILDECLPKRLISELPGYEVVTVPMVGWAGVKNGELLGGILKPVAAHHKISVDELVQKLDL